MRHGWLLLVLGVVAVSWGLSAEASKRVPWTTSRVKGTPEKPPPYRSERAFPKLTFREPIFLVRAPGIDRWFLGERFGTIYSFPKDPKVTKADVALDIKKDIHSWDPAGKVRGVQECYAMTFHPQFAKNRYCYICYLLAGKDGAELDDGTRISRFKVLDTDPPRIDPKSETIVLTFLCGGHNGCDLHFGNDGYLYISTGDGTGPNPPDGRDTGQDLSDLLGSILRIDVDRAENGKNYAIPSDNPFLTTPKARPEIYAYGLRNPFRMSFDRKTGDLWVGDVGWELWEMIHKVRKGGNYGWSVKEGPLEIRPNAKRGPTPILPPTIELPHTEAASITGGYVYHGKRLPELSGAYICGDWATRKLWATKFEGDRKLWHKEIAHGAQRVVAFGEDVDGELYFLHHDEKGSIHYLARNEAAEQFTDSFPRKLSETGLLASTTEYRLANGVLPFEVNAPRWADHATAERFVALPGTSSGKLFDKYVWVDPEFYGSYFFPGSDAVLGETLSIEMEQGNPRTRKRLETQVLHWDGKLWRGYSYLWNDAGTDAELVEPKGKDLALDITDSSAPGGKRKQIWHVPSRGECLICHNPWAGIALGFTPRQLDREVTIDGRKVNQLDHFKKLGLLELWHHGKRKDVPLNDALPEKLVDPHDSKANLERRARSYLQVNCAHCHQYNAGGTVDIDLRIDTPLVSTKTVGVKPVQGTFGLPDGRILAAGDPYRSILYYRMAKLGRGRMPHLGSSLVDEAGIRLISDWIRTLPTNSEAWILLQKLRDLDEATALEKEKADLAARIEDESYRFASYDGRTEPSDADRQQAKKLVAKEAAKAAKDRPLERKRIYEKLLASADAALILMQEMGEGRMAASTRPEVIQFAMAHPDPLMRDLFERFAPQHLRAERLGTNIVPEKLFAITGNVDRGRDAFFLATFQCGTCHTVKGKGGQVGPDLSEVAKRLSRTQILESIVEPSKVIDAKFVTYVVETSAGQLHQGLLLDRNDRELILRQVGNKDLKIPAADVVAVQTQKTSLMPDQLLRDASPQQAADLLAFLMSLK